MSESWCHLRNASEIPSPSLLIYPDRVEENIRRMLAIIGNAERLRPHIKTHKLPELIRLQQKHGIHKFKCATIAEAEMVAGCEAKDVLLAYQPVGPNVQRFLQLIRQYPATAFSTIVDNMQTAEMLHKAASPTQPLEVLLDLDMGMGRCGIPPGKSAMELYAFICHSSSLRPGGLHVYDGHLHMTDLEERTSGAAEVYSRATEFRQQLQKAGLPVPRMVVGGTPTFPMHAKREEIECSPGTSIFWDWGYSSKFPDMDFLHSALLLTRVISKPSPMRLCLDLGHKAVASENPHPRVVFLDLPDATAVMHSEEHLVVESDRAGEFAIGDVLYGVPRHVCPTVALHEWVVVVRNGIAQDRWQVVARARSLGI